MWELALNIQQATPNAVIKQLLALVIQVVLREKDEGCKLIRESGSEQSAFFGCVVRENSLANLLTTIKFDGGEEK